MVEESERLLFRLQHIIPKSLSAAPGTINHPSSITKTTSPDLPEEMTFQMTFGKVAGIDHISLISIVIYINL